MKIGDTIKSKSTGKIYKVVEQAKNRDGFHCEDIDGDRYYFFDSEVDVVPANDLDLTQPNAEDIANALIVIQNDLLNCKNAMELGEKYKNYNELLSQLLLKGVEKLCETTSN